MEKLILRTQNGDAAYKINSADFSLVNNNLCMAIEAELADEDDEESPREILLSLINHPYDGSEQIEIKDQHTQWGPQDGKPHAYVYTGFHATNVHLFLQSAFMSGDEMKVDFKIVTDDVRYYGEQAQDSIIVGSCSLSKMDPADLWAP